MFSFKSLLSSVTGSSSTATPSSNSSAGNTNKPVQQPQQEQQQSKSVNNNSYKASSSASPSLSNEVNEIKNMPFLNKDAHGYASSSTTIGSIQDDEEDKNLSQGTNKRKATTTSSLGSPKSHAIRNMFLHSSAVSKPNRKSSTSSTRSLEAMKHFRMKQSPLELLDELERTRSHFFLDSGVNNGDIKVNVSLSKQQRLFDATEEALKILISNDSSSSNASGAVNGGDGDESAIIKGTSTEDTLLKNVERMDIYSDAILYVLYSRLQKNYSAFIKGMNHIQDVDLDIAKAVIHVSNARRRLASSKKSLVDGHLHVINLQRQKQRAIETNKILTIVSEYNVKKMEITACCRDGDIQEAIKKVISLSAALESDSLVPKLLCLASIKQSTNDSIPMLRDMIDKKLEMLITGKIDRKKNGQTDPSSTSAFDVQYKDIIEAYKLLEEKVPGGLSEVPNKVQEFARKGIDGIFLRGLTPLLLLGNTVDESFSTVKRLCEILPVDSRNAHELLISIVKAYKDATDVLISVSLAESHALTKDLKWDNDLRKRIWESLESNACYVLQSPSTGYQGVRLRQFRRLIAATESLVQIGIGFTRDQSSNLILNNMIRDRSRLFCSFHHTESMEALRNFLSKDSWIRVNDDTLSISAVVGLSSQEKTLASKVSEAMDNALPGSSNTPKPPSSTISASIKWDGAQNPFADIYESIIQSEQALLSEGKDDDSRLTPMKDTSASRSISPGPVVVFNITMLSCIVPQAGRSLNLMRQLPLSAGDAFNNLRSLFDVYAYSVLNVFGLDKDIQDLNRVPSQRSLIPLNQYPVDLLRLTNYFSRFTSSNADAVAFPCHIPPGGDHFNIKYRCVAAETLSTIIELANVIQSDVEPLLPAVERKKLLEKMYGDMIKAVDDSRKLIHRCIAFYLLWETGILSSSPTLMPPSAFQIKQQSAIESKVSGVQWANIKSIQTESNSYINQIMQLLRRALDILKKESDNGNSYPISIVSSMWDSMVSQAMDELLEAFANVKKCSTEGRALMSLDLATLHRSAHEIMPCGPLSVKAKTRVDSFIKAYYYDRESDILDWISQHRNDFLVHHCMSLMECSLYGIKNKKKQNIKSEVERVLFG